MKNPTPPERRATDHLRKIIKERLCELKLSPKAAETSAGVPPDTIKSVLRGQSPSYEKLVKICGALKMRLTIERVEPQETHPATPAGPDQEAIDNTKTSSEKSRAARRQTAKNDVRATYYASTPRGEIVEQLR